MAADNVRALYTKNAQNFREMLAKAEASPRQSCNGYRVEALRANVARYDALSRATDAELTAHFAKTRIACAFRLEQRKGGR